jgi:hypothetical protein
MIGTEQRRGNSKRQLLDFDPLAALLRAISVAAAAWSDPGLSSYRRQGVGLQARVKTNSPVCHQGEGAIPLPQQKYKRNWTTMRGRNEHPGERFPLTSAGRIGAKGQVGRMNLTTNLPPQGTRQGQLSSDPQLVLLSSDTVPSFRIAIQEGIDRSSGVENEHPG